MHECNHPTYNLRTIIAAIFTRPKPKQVWKGELPIMKFNIKTIFTYLVLYPVMVFCCLEIAFWILAYRPYKNENYSVDARPANAFTGHPTLGIQLHPGDYQVTVNDSLHFRARHQENQTRQVSGSPDPGHPDVLMLGCSFTYGFGVNDDQHFTSLLQQKFPAYSFQNAGVIGYGTVQSLLQLREQVSKRQLQAVVLNLSSFHLMRNTLSPRYRSNLKIGYARSSQAVDSQMGQARFPYLPSCTDSIRYADWKDIYKNWPGREWLASINWFQTLSEGFRENRETQREVTLCLIREIDRICRDQGIAFGVACLDTSADTEWIKDRVAPIPWLNVNFDFLDHNQINYPYDSHPNPAGHRLIAARITSLLSQLLDGQ